MKIRIALRKLNNKKNKLTPEEMVAIGTKVHDYKVWRKVIEKIDFSVLNNDQVIDLFFQSKSDYFRNNVKYKFEPVKPIEPEEE